MAKSFKVLYVATEIKPFLNDTYVADIVRKLPQGMQEKGVEIRILVPKFGLINERKNRLHEVVRLSGMNIPIGDDDKPLIIKVASIPTAKLQVYFIDNEDYFKRKTVFNNKAGKFHKDNDERCLFFCKGVLETVIFENTKCIFSIYENSFKEKLDKKMIDKIIDEDIDKEMLSSLKSNDYSGLIKIASEYSDAIIRPDKDLNKSLEESISSISPKNKVHKIPENEKSVESHYKLYNEILN